MKESHRPAAANRSVRPGRRLVASAATAALLLAGCAAPRVGAEAQGTSTAPKAEQSTGGSLKDAEILAQRYTCVIKSVEDTRMNPGPELNIPGSQDRTTVQIKMSVSTTEQAKQLLGKNNGSVPAQLLTPSSIGASVVNLRAPEENSEPIPLGGANVVSPDTTEDTIDITLYPPADVYRAGNQAVEIAMYTRVTTDQGSAGAMDTEAVTTCGAVEFGPAGYQMAEDYTLPPPAITTFEHMAG